MTVTYQIVGEDEADIKNGKISVNSPVARALIGKYAGDIAQVQAPGGMREYEIHRRPLRVNRSYAPIFRSPVFDDHYPVGWWSVGDRLYRCAGAVCQPR